MSRHSGAIEKQLWDGKNVNHTMRGSVKIHKNRSNLILIREGIVRSPYNNIEWGEENNGDDSA